MADEQTRFIRSMVEEVAELQPLAAQHEDENEELLPHVLMGDITRLALDLHKRAERGSGQVAQSLATILARLEEGISSGNVQLRELVVASFLENLDRDDQRFASFRDRLGPNLRTALDRQTRDFLRSD